MTTFNKQDVLGTIATAYDGVTLVVSNKSEVFDYASMVAAQLSALTTVMTEIDGFARFNNEIRNNLLWLVETMAGEVCQLIPLVSQEAQQHAKAKLVGEKPE